MKMFTSLLVSNNNQWNCIDRLFLLDTSSTNEPVYVLVGSYPTMIVSRLFIIDYSPRSTQCPCSIIEGSSNESRVWLLD